MLVVDFVTSFVGIGVLLFLSSLPTMGFGLGIAAFGGLFLAAARTYGPIDPDHLDGMGKLLALIGLVLVIIGVGSCVIFSFFSLLMIAVGIGAPLLVLFAIWQLGRAAWRRARLLDPAPTISCFHSCAGR